MPSPQIELIDTLISAGTAAVVATGGWLVTRSHAHALQRQKDRLDFINKQIGEFYGPLHAANIVSRSAFETMKHHLKISGGISDTGKDYSATQLEQWMIWMKCTFGPLNEHRTKLILEKAYLFEGTETGLPAIFEDYLKHALRGRVILSQWKQKNFQDLVPEHPFPQGLDEYVRNQLDQLRKRQLQLLGHLQKPWYRTGLFSRPEIGHAGIGGAVIGALIGLTINLSEDKTVAFGICLGALIGLSSGILAATFSTDSTD